MAFELEALVGHMYVAGGRTIKTTPPGALCEVAPKRAARGREIDTLFVLVIPSGNVAPNTFYEQMSLMAAERYFSNTGSVTSALRDVFNTLNNNLFEHNAKGHKHYEANMIVAVMRGTDLYVGRSGASTLIIRHSGETKTVPENLRDDDKLFMPPLGVQPIPEVEMARFVLDSGTRMIMADTSIVEITDEKLTQAMLASNIEEVLDEFKVLVTLQIQLMVVEFVPPEQPVMVPAATGQSSAVISAEIAAERAKTSSKQAPILDEATGATSKERPKRDTPRSRLKKRFKNAVVSVSRGLGHSMSRVGNLGRIFWGGEAKSEQRKRNTTLISLAVFAIPTVLISAVLLSWVGNVGQTAYEECVERANNSAIAARGLPSDNRDSLMIAWSTNLVIIEECRDYRPEFFDPNLDAIEAEAQFAVDTLSSITRRSTTVIWSSPIEAANIREIVLQGVDSIYAFDNTNSVVYRLQLNETGDALITQPQPITNMSIGARVDGNTLGRLIGIAYDEQRDRIVTIDENGIMVSCRPLSINQCEAQQLLGFEVVTNPIRLEFFANNLYVLDTGGEQIWRYSPVGSTNNYSNPPTEYYQGGLRPPNMTDAVDFAIGNPNSNIPGHVYTLFSDGTMSHYYNGDAQNFGFSGFPSRVEKPEETTTQSMFLNDSNLFTGFYVISRPLRTIYYTTTAGTFQNIFRVRDESRLERLNDVVADPEQNIVYIASGNSVFAFTADE
ncbi:MAG: hypothetical protein Phog2KO_30690 [Phototrophicaceae bacterium]